MSITIDENVTLEAPSSVAVNVEWSWTPPASVTTASVTPLTEAAREAGRAAVDEFPDDLRRLADN